MIRLIKEILDDHRIIRNLSRRFENETNTNERQKIANTIIREISIHSACEEINVYPAFEKYMADGNVIADHSRQEHLQVKKDLHQLDYMKVTDPGYLPLFRKTIKELNEHIAEEENDLLPKLKDLVSQEELDNLAKNYVNTRPSVPTHPHPSAPDKPPGETIAGMMTAPLDKVVDLTREYVDTGRDKL